MLSHFIEGWSEASGENARGRDVVEPSRELGSNGGENTPV